MTIKECIDIVDNIKPNQYTVADKVNWLTFVDMTIINDVLKTHEGYDGRYDLFEGYSPDKLTASLVVPTPYDRLYTAYLSMQIDRLNGETAKYNNSASLYNTYLLEYKRYYNKTHMPLDITRKGYGEKPPKKHTVGLTAAEYENLKRDLYFALSADVNEVISPDKLYDIVTSYAYNNIEMLKGADGKTPVRGVDYFTEDDINAMVAEVLKVNNEKISKLEADAKKADEKLNLHTNNKDNPHGVTAKQVGAYLASEVDKLLEDTANKNHVHELAEYTEYRYSDEKLASWTNIVRGDSVVTVKDGKVKIPVDSFTRVVFNPTYADIEGKTLKVTIKANKCVVMYAYSGKSGVINQDGSPSDSVTWNVDVPETGFLLKLESTEAWLDSYIEIDVVYDTVAKDGFMSSEDKKRIGDIDKALDAILEIQEELMPKGILD